MYTHQQTYYLSIICAHAHINRVTVDGHAIVEDAGDKLISSEDALKLPAFRFFFEEERKLIKHTRAHTHGQETV
jgi:hypothetical protein